MAFKSMKDVPVSTEAEILSAHRKRDDKNSFQGKVGQDLDLHVVDHPVVDPIVSRTTIAARDAEGPLTLVLQGDRSPGSLFEPEVVALSRGLEARGDGLGLPAQARGVIERVGLGGRRDPKGRFRCLFVETLAVDTPGGSVTFGRPREDLDQEGVRGDIAPMDVGQPSAARVQQEGVDLGPDRAGAGVDGQDDGTDGLFAGRRLRRVRLSLSGVDDAALTTGEVFRGANERGAVAVVVPGRRGEGWEDSDAGGAMKEAWGKGRTIPAEVEGFFRSRRGPDSQGKEHTSWDFVASRITVKTDRGATTIGREVPAAVQDAPVALAAARTPRRASSRGTER